jgi:hypothetical protein
MPIILVFCMGREMRALFEPMNNYIGSEEEYHENESETHLKIREFVKTMMETCRILSVLIH